MITDVANRVLFYSTATIAAIFAIVAAMAFGKHKPAMLLVAGLISVSWAGSAVMSRLAAHRMRANRPHSLLHLGSVTLLVLPVALVVVGLLAAG